MIPNRKALVCIGLLVMAGTVQADPTFITTCPFLISSPGRYLLGADLICGGGDGITITSSDVTLALEGHRITAGVNADRAIIANPQAGPALPRIRILGPGLITNGGENRFRTGVALFRASTSEVSGVTVLGTTGAGLFGAGISCGLCNFDVTITANTLGRNTTGILLNQSAATISQNDVSGNGTGFVIVASFAIIASTGIVTHNIVNGNTGDGMDIDGRVIVQNNVVNGNGLDGIHSMLVFGEPGAEFISNTSLANGRFDLSDTAPGCSGTVWSGNTFFTANQSCIH